jgi:hypothetical protein
VCYIWGHFSIRPIPESLEKTILLQRYRAGVDDVGSIPITRSMDATAFPAAPDSSKLLCPRKVGTTEAHDGFLSKWAGQRPTMKINQEGRTALRT